MKIQFSFVLLLASTVAGASQFPAVKPMDLTVAVKTASKATLNWTIYSVKGLPLYLPECHSGFCDDVHFSYTGDFECRLGLADGLDTYSTLLTEDIKQQKDWESRGRFFAANLNEPCASIPQFGATRSFELRGLRLNLQVVHPVFGRDGALQRLKLHISVRPDPAARRVIAAAIPLPKHPPARCKISLHFPDPAKF